jgi:ADP-ribosyltransferase exoenzyme
MAGVGNVGGGNWGVMSTQLHALKNANQGAGDKHVRGTTGSTQLYVHGDKTHGIGSRQPKYKEGVSQIKAALDQDFGPGFGDLAFKQLGKTKGAFGSNPEKGLKLKDLGKLDTIVTDYGAKYQAVHNDPLFQAMGAEKFFGRLASVEECIANASSPQARADANQLSDLQKVAIHTYTDHKECYLLNRMLRDAQGDPKSLNGTVAESYIQHITAGLAALPPPNPANYESYNDQGNVGVMAYRGAKRIDPTVEQGYRKGNEVTEFAFTSTSASNDKSFGGAFQFTMFLSPQTAGRDISAFSSHNEREILFPPGTKFDVISRKGDADFLGIEMEAGTGVNVVMREK